MFWLNQNVHTNKNLRQSAELLFSKAIFWLFEKCVCGSIKMKLLFWETVHNFKLTQIFLFLLSHSFQLNTLNYHLMPVSTSFSATFIMWLDLSLFSLVCLRSNSCWYIEGCQILRSGTRFLFCFISSFCCQFFSSDCPLTGVFLQG